MRAIPWALVGALALCVVAADGVSQPPPGKGAKPPPDEDKEFLDEIGKTYRPPFEQDEKILKEIRKACLQQSAEQEGKVFKEVRKLYQPTAEQEAAILRELRRAYQQPSAAAEGRVLAEVRKAPVIPPGVVPPDVLAEEAGKLFGNLDRNGDRLLNPDEMSEALRGERARWDADRDGLIDPAEYLSYAQARTRLLAERFAAGQPLERGGPATLPAEGEGGRPLVYRPGQLPAGLPPWFSQLDADRDAQIGLYEWRRSGRPLDEFDRMDRNGDGFLTVEEVLRSAAQGPGAFEGGKGKGSGKKSEKE